MNIKIIPKKLSGTADAPSSKSAAHRALVCAALADGKSTVKINGISEDIAATVGCLEQLGAKIKISGENVEVMPAEKYPESAVLDCGESGSTLRFLLPVAAALGISAVFTGRGRLGKRPVEDLLCELRNHGVRCSDGFPVEISGKLTDGSYKIPGNITSQYATGLMLALTVCGGELTITEPIESKPYIELTAEIMRGFGAEIENENNTYKIKKKKLTAKSFNVEGDWTNAAALIACGAEVRNLDKNSVQGDRKILGILEKFGAEIYEKNGAFSADFSSLNAAEIDAKDIPDLVSVIAVIAAAAEGRSVIKNVFRLKYKESDRIASTVQLINSLGSSAEAVKNEIIIDGGGLDGGTVDSCGDHRIVMAAAAAARFCENSVIIKNAEAVSKSFPDFFDIYNSLGGAAHVM